MSETELREEWTVQHSQGVHPGPFTEAQAREWIARDLIADERRQLRARGKQRLLHRFVTEWEEVPLAPAVPTHTGSEEPRGASDE